MGPCDLEGCTYPDISHRWLVLNDIHDDAGDDVLGREQLNTQVHECLTDDRRPATSVSDIRDILCLRPSPRMSEIKRSDVEAGES